MKRFFVILPLLSIACADPPPQKQPKLSPLPMNCVSLEWEGVGDRMYFVNASTDLLTWFYLGIIEPGQPGFIHGYGMEADGQKVFWKLRWSDRDPNNPNWANDCDGDGLENRFEVNTGYDPLDEDTDGDQVLDGSEDDDQDGSLTGTEAAALRDPRTKDHPAVELNVVATTP